ncbi:probable pectinesterase/pectinesterase inhibitor 41 [Rhododendron vialii]|uniref:probable pectinesterase/pectinesterase inhibitor 41 n=1 Tax=Rhododendron vialii TaxID=182163 RepID=UPI00265F3BDD|nr:probable pectinesterase/pectinesterase inhibitor 41 [Rhododendron vialii]
MASNLFFSEFSSFTLSLLLLIFCLSSSLSSADVVLPPSPSPSPSPSTPVSTGTICSYTLDPSFCRSQLPKNNSANLYDYGRLSFRKSLSSASKFLKLILRYLKHPSSLTPSAIAALTDCKYLASRNLDFLSTSFQTVSNTSCSPLDVSTADYVQTLLSGILTNTQTCLDGLQATASAWTTVGEGIYAPLANNTKLFSMSLALFTKGWVPEHKNRTAKHVHKRHLPLRNGTYPFKMSSHHKAIFESTSGRKLLQTSSDDGQVLVNNMVTVSQDGGQNFITVSEAVAAAPNNTNGSTGYFLIYVTAGVYYEYVTIPENTKYVMMIGDGINQTVITGNHSVADGWTTFNSATLIVEGEGFVAVGISFRNTAGAIKAQAVAVRTSADLSSFYSCSFEAYQDTLYAHSLRQFYQECDIYGTVDFIFGNAAVVFQDCNIYPRQPLKGQSNTITAQGRTDPNQNTGTSIQNATITPAADLASSNFTVQTYLGRPWKLYSTAVFMQSYMGGLINPAGWLEWSGDFALNTSYYAEFGNTGPGSNTAERVTWPCYHIITAAQAANFTVANFLVGDGWLPETGVPYTDGLE